MHSSQECEDSLGPLKRDASLLVLLKLEVEGGKKEKKEACCVQQCWNLWPDLIFPLHFLTHFRNSNREYRKNK